MYLHPKIHKSPLHFHSLPIMPYCATPLAKLREFLVDHLRPAMQSNNLYIKDTED